MIEFLREEWWFTAIIGFVLALITAAVFFSIKESNECEARGGQMVGTGEYYTTVTMVGKVPVANTYEHQECSVPAPEERL